MRVSVDRITSIHVFWQMWAVKSMMDFVPSRARNETLYVCVCIGRNISAICSALQFLARFAGRCQEG